MILPVIISDKSDKQELVVPSDHHPCRLDRFLTAAIPSKSRTFWQERIEQGVVFLNGATVTKAGRNVFPGDRITVLPLVEEPERHRPTPQETREFLANWLIATHEHFWVVNKPAGLTVHAPAPHFPESTLADYFCCLEPSLYTVGEPHRPGIVHRLDKETSGVMLVARTPHGYEQLKKLFGERLVKKTYCAFVHGHPEKMMTFTDPIIRDPFDRRRMVCSLSAGAPAQTTIEVVSYFETCSFIRAYPATGRTHQIRVHCATHGFPVVGDILYGTPDPVLKRHALHATQISFVFDGQPYTFEAELPEELALYGKSCKLKGV